MRDTLHGVVPPKSTGFGPPKTAIVGAADEDPGDRTRGEAGQAPMGASDLAVGGRGWMGAGCTGLDGSRVHGWARALGGADEGLSAATDEA